MYVTRHSFTISINKKWMKELGLGHKKVLKIWLLKNIKIILFLTIYNSHKDL